MTIIRNSLDPEFNGLKLAADWIRDLESSDSRLHKEAVIEKALVAARLGSTNAQCFLYNCYLAYNPFYVYNVKQVPETQDLENRPNPWVKFWALLEALRTRSITGHRARDTIADLSEEFDSLEWNNLCRRVLIKDLRCGISEKTLNKVLKNTDWVIPTFTCQLAQDSNDHPAKLKGAKRLEVKLDGVRVIAICYKEGAVNLFSRNGKPFTNFPHIEEQLESIARELSIAAFGQSVDFVLDGEIIGESFQALMKQAQRKTNVDASDSKYFVFDVMPKTAFFEGHHNAQQYKRIDMLHTMFNKVDDSTLAPDVQITPGITVDLNIVGFEEGTGKNLGRLGAIVCKGVDNDRRINVNVGSGLTDSDRDSFWANRDQLLGRVVEVKADAVTQNQDGTYSLRFPRFERFRDALTGEKE